MEINLEIKQEPVRLLLHGIGDDEWSHPILGGIRNETNCLIFGIGTSAPIICDGFHDYLVRGISDKSADLEFTDFQVLPIDKKLYSEVRETEGASLRMLDRVDGFRVWQRNNLSDRRSCFFNEVAFWSQYLDENKISAAVFSNIPHEFYDYIIYNLCISRGIPTLILHYTCNVDTLSFTAVEKIEEVGDLQFATELKEVCEPKEPQNFRLQISDAFLDSHSLGGVNSKDFVDRRRSLEQSRFDQTSLDVSTKINLKDKVIRRLFRLLAAYDYLRIKKLKDMPVNFVYFPLHVEPEQAISPLGGHFEEQLDAVRFIVSRLPEDWKVLVKEHPDQIIFGPRRISFYQNLSKIPGVCFAKTGVSSTLLISRCKAVATISGTAGLEAWRVGKPSWLLGRSWYMAAPGISKIDTVGDLEKAFEALFTMEIPSGLDIENHLDLLYRSNFYGFLPGYPYFANPNESGFIQNLTVSNVSTIVNNWLKLRVTSQVQ